ncbi:MAG: lamin tail domain-containing protein [Acidimicrobiia bacterium]|nr:lamin tail domain-containing protein [Acidimicrobiia bacterium]
MKRSLLAVLLVVGACGTGSSAATTTQPAATTSAVTTSPVTTSAATTSPVGDGDAPAGTTAEVTEVLDGDSIAVVVGGRDDELRLLGINAPEPDECFADEARALLATVARDRIVIVGDGRDQFGRILGYAYRGADNLNQWMLASGGALATTPDHDLLPDFLAAEQDAELRGIGMWAEGICASAAASGVSIYEVEFDAPGRDDENPNGEYVIIANEGDPANLTGWMLRDESSAHRYAFPDGTVLGFGKFLVVRSGCGDDTAEDLYWCAEGAVWNNDGDTALLIDPDGAYVSRLRYFGD